MTTLQPKRDETASTVETMDFNSDGRLYAVDLMTNSAKFDQAGRVREVEFGADLSEEMASSDGKWIKLSGVATFDEVAGWMRIDATAISEPKRLVTAEELLSRPPVPTPPPSRRHKEFVASDPFDVHEFLETIYVSSRGRSWNDSRVNPVE